MKNILNILLRKHTVAQKVNHIKSLLSKKGEVLNYGPLTISIVATTRCTLSCDMCPTHSKLVPRSYEHIQKNASDIDFGMFKGIIDRFKDALTVHIIGSGEPFLNKDFFRMVDYAAGKNMTVKTFSNGTTINDNIGNILNSRLDGVTISINGHDSKEFNRMTGMSEEIYFKIFDAVKALIDEKNSRGSKVKVKLSFIVDRHNYKFMPEMIGLGLSLGADHMFFCNFLPSPYENLKPDERMLLCDEKVSSWIRSMIRRYPSKVRKKITLPVLLDKNAGKNCCKTHFEQIRLDGDGNVSSCSMMLLDMTGHGNYREEDVWNNAFFRTMRRAFLSGDPALIPGPCGVCPDNKGVPIAV